ncbi:hypothetical protein [Enterobacter cloacae]|uniref:hypothetical protein n=1 Tax=Enterobacter cloacae TaxID=550 RepID=UPI002469210C|nr:hypothetical protein [Enterobacter cloacae]WGL81761.1 hypothetical protein QFB83_20405 [Enterobacter cloacae]
MFWGVVCSSERPGSGWIDIRIGQQGAKHHTTKAFLQHQRVTTEGKAMAIDATLKVKQINSINPYGDGWNRHMEIDIDSIELVECVKPEEIISEYTAASLLDAMDESDVVSWLENEGYTVTND